MRSVTWIFLIVWLTVLDHLSKITAVLDFPATFVKNYGSAFSLAIPLNLTVLLSFGFIGFVFYLVMIKNENYPVVWALAVSGALGNLIDRLALGYVIDFVHVGRFPVFNLADVYLTLSAMLLIYFYTLKKRHD